MADTLYLDALKKIRELARTRSRPQMEELFPTQALGRIVAAEVRSPVSIPQYSNSAVDGFAFRSADVAAVTSPRRFSVQGLIIAGNTPLMRTTSEGAWEIMTGAPFPKGYDCSVKVEDVEVIRDSSGRAKEMVLKKSLEPLENLRGAGEDFLLGDSVISAGERIAPEHILALEALGVSKIQVFKKPMIAVISTGGELCAPGEALREGQIRNSTAPFLLATLGQMGCEPTLYGTASDSPEEYFSILKKVIGAKPDVVISTGAVSMGVHDYVSSVVADLGARIDFHRVSIRPGKPILFAEFPNGGPLFFGLPGNPVSTVVGLRFFVDAYLREWTGQSEEKPLWARLSAKVRKPEGLRCFFKAKMSLEKGEAQVSILSGQPSFMISPLLHSSAWGVLPEARTEIPAGEWIEVYPVYSSAYSWSHSVANSHQDSNGGCCT